jgi:hypothetical protein
MRGFSAFGVLLVCSLVLRAQEQSPSAKPAPQEHPPSTPSGISAAEVAAANNPVANLDSVSFQNLYDPTLFGVPNVLSDTLDMRGVIVSGRQIIRLTLPISTVPTGRSTIDLPGGGSVPSISVPIGPVQYRSGIGDANLFDSIVLTGPSASTTLAVGPQLVAPTATNSSLGSGKWQRGLPGSSCIRLQAAVCSEL